MGTGVVPAAMGPLAGSIRTNPSYSVSAGSGTRSDARVPDATRVDTAPLVTTRGQSFVKKSASRSPARIVADSPARSASSNVRLGITRVMTSQPRIAAPTIAPQKATVRPAGGQPPTNPDRTLQSVPPTFVTATHAAIRKNGYACSVKRQSKISCHVTAYGTREATRTTSSSRPAAVPVNSRSPASAAQDSHRPDDGTHRSKPPHLFAKG